MPTYSKQITKAMNYMSSHIEDNLVLNDIAEHAGISKYHFHRLFRAFVGESVGEFQRRVKLERAATMLVYHEHKPIKDIAFESGFSTSQNFAKLFKKKYGISPQEYRLTAPKFVPDKNSKIGNINQVEHSYYCIDNNSKNDATMYAKLNENVTVENALDQLVLFVRKQGEYSYSELVEIYDELFVVPKTRIFEFRDALEKNRLKIKFSCNARVDVFDEELAKCLKECGCTFLNFGFESSQTNTIFKVL